MWTRKQKGMIWCFVFSTKKNKLPLYEELDTAIKKAMEARSIVPNFKNFTQPETFLTMVVTMDYF